MFASDRSWLRRKGTCMASGASLYCAIFGVDVAGFGHPGRDDDVQIAIRSALYRILQDAWIEARCSWDECHHEDR